MRNLTIASLCLTVFIAGCGKEEAATTGTPSTTGKQAPASSKPPFDEQAAEKAISEIRSRVRALPASELDLAASLMTVAEWLKDVEKATSAGRNFHDSVVKAGGPAAEGLLDAPKSSVLLPSFDFTPLLNVDRVRGALTTAFTAVDPELDRVVELWGKVHKGLSSYLDATKKVEDAVQTKLATVKVIALGEDTARKMRNSRLSSLVGANLSGLYQGGVGGRGGWPTQQSLGFLEDAAKKEKDQETLAFVAQLRKSLDQVRAACSSGKEAVSALRAILTPEAGVVKNWDPQQIRVCRDGLDVLSNKLFHFENWGSGQIDPERAIAILVRREESAKVIDVISKHTSQVPMIKKEIEKYRSQSEAQIATCHHAAEAWSKTWEVTKDFSGMADENRYLTTPPPAKPKEPPSQANSADKSAKSYRIEGDNYYCSSGKKSLLLKVPAKYKAVFVESVSQKEPNEARVSGRFNFVGNGQGTNLFGGPVMVEIWAADETWAATMLSHVKAIQEYERKNKEFETLKSAQTLAWNTSNAKIIDYCRKLGPPHSPTQFGEYLASLRSLRDAVK